MRWTQLGALSPIMQMHRKVQRGMQYPWSYGAEALENYRVYARLHVSLFPYLYSYAKVAAETGVPIIRPLVLMNQSDPNTASLDDAYLFGNELLVAPIIVSQATGRSVYLPRGGWYDYWTNRRFEGGHSVNWSGPRSEIPLFVREGAIIPLVSPDGQTPGDSAHSGATPSVPTTTALDFAVYPAGASAFTVYDGTRVNCQTTSASISLTLTSVGRPVEFRILEAHRPSSVTLNGHALPERADLDRVSAGWTQTGGFIVVKFPHPGRISRVAIQVPTN
jgi:alpha-glucosidase (family GH31 glycosyl hydrolase)